MLPARMARGVMVAVLLALLLAGCADGGPSREEQAVRASERAAEALPLEPTSSTGIVRGFVMDAAVRPLEGAEVRLDPGERSMRTGPSGEFGFDRLLPGLYFLEVWKTGYHGTRMGVEVVAAAKDPDLVKVYLQPTGGAWVEALHYEGFIDSAVSYSLQGESRPLFTSRVTTVVTGEDGGMSVDYDVDDEDIRWIQQEMVWQPTQSAGAIMAAWCYSVREDEALVEAEWRTTGPSPMLTDWGPEDVATMKETSDLLNCHFASGAQGDPAGVGVTLMQTFDVFSHIFHGTMPPAGWRFTSDGAPGLPPP